MNSWLILAGLRRKPARSALTILSVASIFLLIGLLAGLKSGVDHAIAVAHWDRLFAHSRDGKPLPIAYRDRIAALPGVSEVAAMAAVMARHGTSREEEYVNASDRRFFRAFSETTVTPAQLAAFDRAPTGAIVDVSTAEKYGWKEGDSIVMASSLVTSDGRADWPMKIVAVVDNSDHPGQWPFILIHYQYLNERRAADRDTVNAFTVRIADPRHAAQIAGRMDALFQNSSAPTRTMPEKEQTQTALRIYGDITFFTLAVIGAGLFMLLFVTGAVMSQAVRERGGEFATMKAMGFSDGGLFLLVLAESAIICGMGAVAGLTLAKLALPTIAAHGMVWMMELMRLPWPLLFAGFGLAMAMAVAAAIGPALKVRRLRVAEALARL